MAGQPSLGRGMTKPGGAMPWLVGYYGIFELGFVLSVVSRGGLRPIQGFPPPPIKGWHPQPTALWTGMGLIDTVIALLALYFVAAYFRGRRQALWAGLISLTTFVYNTFTINYSAVATGAWARHPAEYVVLNAVSIPLVLLFALVVGEVRSDSLGGAGST